MTPAIRTNDSIRNKEQRLTFWALFIIGIVYLAILIPANLTGAENPDMLEVFEVDEYAQYPHLIHMLTPGDSLYQSVRNFLIYVHYYYGYPFYFWSAVSILPVRVLGGAEWESCTRIILCILREVISVLPMVIAIGLLVWVSTHFRNPVLAVSLDLLLLTFPAVLQNNFWWHPDSLAMLFVSLTFFFLDRDQNRCGWNFLAAAAACGAATGTKYTGLYFGLAIPVYLFFAWRRGTLSLSGAIKKAILFLAVMALGILVSDPLLLLPQERAEILKIMRQQMELSGIGIFLRYETPFLENGQLPAWLTENYLRLPMLLLCFGGLLCALFSRENKESRPMAAVSFCYLLLGSVVLVSAAARRLHYFLPILTVLAAQLPALFNRIKTLPHRGIMTMTAFLALAVQFGLNLNTDISFYKTQLTREENSASIALYRTLEESYLPLPEVPEERMTRVYRDWKVYFPEQEGYAVRTDWNLAAQDLITEWHPDLILLEKENIRAYSSEDVLSRAVNEDQMNGLSSFYRAAADNKLPGYQVLLENSFGIVFRKDVP